MRFPHVHPFVLDLALALGLTVMGASVLKVEPAPAGASTLEFVRHWLPFALMPISTMSIALRRYFPLSVMVTTIVALAASPLVDDSAAGWVTTFIATFSAGLSGADRRHVLVAFATLAVIDVALLATKWTGTAADPFFAVTFLMFAAIFWAGAALRSREREALVAQERATRLEIERELATERAAADERARIARELHDVIAHSLSVMVIQAAAARRVLDQDPAKALASLDAIEQTGRTAMVEMRRLLGVVRRDQPSTDSPTAPQPSLDSLDALISDMQRAGLKVELRTEGDARPIAPGVDVSAYRIIQEALTNALRHAHASQTEVVVRYLPDSLEVSVVDDGRGSSGRSDDPGSTGHGLVGMRERVSLLRGELLAGPRQEGGFSVRAILPSEPAGRS